MTATQLQIGPHTVTPPVVLAPMAGITNAPFRTLCREFSGGKALRMIVEEGLADHIDLNFGCPVPKVTRKGGGSALPYKRHLLRSILREAVTGAGPLPVTMKLRKGIDDDHITYLDAGRIAVE